METVTAEDAGASNLPKWQGAAHCYSRAYRLLEQWGAANYAAAASALKGRHRRVGGVLVMPCPVPTDEMKSLTDALQRGDEEKIKGILLLGDSYRTVFVEAEPPEVTQAAERLTRALDDLRRRARR